MTTLTEHRGAMRGVKFLAGAAVFALAAISDARGTYQLKELFRIERSTNRNVVRYDARLTSDGTLDPAEPVTAYWILLSKDGRREALTWLERQVAYGYSTRREGDGVRLLLKAFDRRAVHVRHAPDGYHAEVTISGKPAKLQKIWVQAESGFLGPSVQWIELSGTDMRSGARVIERIGND